MSVLLVLLYYVVNKVEYILTLLAKAGLYSYLLSAR